MGKTYDLPFSYGGWERIGDVAEPGGPVTDFSAGDSSGHARLAPKDGAPNQVPHTEKLDAVRVRATELLAKRDGISFQQAARQVPRDPRALRELVRELQSNTKGAK